MPLTQPQRSALEDIAARAQTVIDEQTELISEIEERSARRITRANTRITNSTDRLTRANNLLASPEGTKNDALHLLRLLNKKIKDDA